MSSVDSVANEQFLRLYSRHQRQLHAFITMLLVNPADVEEVLQDTSIVLWRRFDEFDASRDFLAWARGIARLQALRWMRQSSHRALPLSDRLIDTLAAEHEAIIDELEARRAALDRCIAKLRPADRDLVHRCYGLGTKFQDVAHALGRPANSVYKSLGRIRGVLLECIQRQLRQEGGL